MTDLPSTSQQKELAIVCTPSHRCPACGDDVIAVEFEPALKVTSVERKIDKFATFGSVPMSRCPVCGMALREVQRVVPLELEGLTCVCGKSDFNFSVSSIKPNKKKNATEWDFNLDVTCKSCKKQKFLEKILNFFKLKKIKVSATGVEVENFPANKS
ncbi:hypothetical protein [Methylobacterium sp. Leaf469]|uniref:hypothetical protein n=1 Tax=Methylobacterium sp. Leaf469 TaxID=1736387 RepID=UPI0012E3F3C6|nr:hypothetical protein [Methylobacterium sp. Leaf469]